ncbi:MAG TPA: hypothetical protein VNN72_09610, partial [Polyangiaceae bacterium]|nr:hypothetical protein [Polyangiaceae bacterium]
MNVTLREVLAGAEQHAVPLTAECVGYLVLGAADQVLGAPRSVGTEDLLLSEDGAVRVAGGRAARADEAERDLRAVLDALLLPASSASAGLLRASRRPPGTGIEGLVRELETALIPVNRSAAKRALSRLQRETRRALDSGRIRVEPSVPPPLPSAQAEPSVVPPHAEGVAVEPQPAVAAQPPAVALPPPVVTPPPSVVAELAASEPLPSVALPPVATELAPLVKPVAMSEHVAVTEPAVEHAELASAALHAERREHTLMLSEVAPREPVAPLAPHLVETRPEPVVRRASQRPAPPAAAIRAEPELAERGHTVPLPNVAPVVPVEAAPEGVTRDTPVLGTRVSAEQGQLENVAAHSAVADDLGDSVALEESELDISVIVEARADVVPAAALDSVAAEDDDGFIEVIFEDQEHTVFPEDHERLVVEPAVLEASETTDPCPPLAAESMLPPPCEVVTAAPSPSVELYAE